MYDEGKKIIRDNEEEYKNHQRILKEIANFINSLSTVSHLKNYEEMIKILIAKKVEFDVLLKKLNLMLILIYLLLIMLFGI